MSEDWQNGGFGLYLHWPFCQSKCPYCDFNSHVADRIDQNRWKSAYLAEIDRIGRETQGRLLSTVFFGGGTPSLMDSDLVAAMLERIRATWTVANDFEVTMEANPGSVEAARFERYAQAGVNRISIGLQALRDGDLKRLGRMHSVAEGKFAYDIARKHFGRVSFDLIYARQDQTAADWQQELTEALAMAPDHLSLYQLTVEEGTVFAARHARGLLVGLPDEDLSVELYDLTQDMTVAAGLMPYEVSNHAKSGQEARHNLIYWRLGDYAGIGPGAHGRLTLQGQRWATEAPKAPGAWLNLVESGATGELPRNLSEGEDQATEYLLNALRLSEGLDVARYARLRGQDLPEKKIAELIDGGFVDLHRDRLRATPTGRMVLNAILRELLVG
ncbi:radical SAM family heme chaperone HemW [Rhodobacter sp. KR11]|uniref:radical SAM family heme chaperone HemW n=1 Tax=Rhodobacter sp. KR11 TaxID=2974588 RepID=UPI002222140E|nr:radical SAM family heme chaperone HemW [Rhodobacter sp. KR11]MCW1918905.1 radical SAM family heme chaperone HemW [Rhodobacter sp. KR11]